VAELPGPQAITVPLTDGGALRAFCYGTRPTVVLVHGFAADGTVWRFVQQRLAEQGVASLALEVRGHGRSSATAGPTTIHALAADLAHVLEHLDLRDVVLVGHSLGGMVIQALGSRHADVVRRRVRGLLLVNATSDPMSSGATRLTVAFLQSRLFGAIDRSSRLRAALARSAFAGPTPPERVQVQAAVRAPALRDRRAILLREITDLRPDNSALDVPTTVLGATEDRAVPRQASQLLADSLPDGRLRMVTGAGHLLPLERPDEVVEEILLLHGGGTDRTHDLS
jgi:pimeloyl-ACP methyl ester carboxylesterase